MCPDGSRLYLAWAALVTQIPAGRYDLAHLMSQTTLESDAAGRAYQQHRLNCAICSQTDQSAIHRLQKEDQDAKRT